MFINYNPELCIATSLNVQMIHVCFWYDRMYIVVIHLLD